jgi:hypothetical protein
MKTIFVAAALVALSAHASATSAQVPFSVYTSPFTGGLVGQSVELDAMLWAPTTPLQGTVRFAIDGTTIPACTAVPVKANVFPAAKCNVPTPLAGTFSVAAYYSGDGSNSAASAFTTLNVSSPPIETHFRVYASAVSAPRGMPIHLYANFRNDVPIPAKPNAMATLLSDLQGTATFLLDGAPLPGCIGLPVRDWFATCRYVPLKPGTVRLSAIYEGGGYAGVSENAYEVRTLPAYWRGTDLNGDGQVDIIWRHADGSLAQWLMIDGAQVGGRRLLPAGSGWTLRFAADFNADGRSDLLFAHEDGRHAIWLMDGDTQIGGAPLLQAGSGMQATHIGDFDGDGKADILWKHADGSSSMWLMDGAAPKAAAPMTGPGGNWHAKHVPDLDGDGKSDILWENDDGSAEAWLMDGSRIVSGRALLGSGTGWTAVLTGDMNDDRKDDIVWKHSDGRVGAWFMDGTRQVDGMIVPPPGAGFLLQEPGEPLDSHGLNIAWRHPDGTVIARGFYARLVDNTPAWWDQKRLAATSYSIVGYVNAPPGNWLEFLVTRPDGAVLTPSRNFSNAFDTILPAGTGYLPLMLPR